MALDLYKHKMEGWPLMNPRLPRYMAYLYVTIAFLLYSATLSFFARKLFKLKYPGIV